MKINKKKSGFTLIELLVVISIIAVLSVVGMVSFGSVNKGARDAKRKSDLKFMQSALEEYHADKIYYPSTVTFGSALTNCTGAYPACTSAATKTYITKLSNDIDTASPYIYRADPFNCDNNSAVGAGGICTSYCLYAKMEKSSAGADATCYSPPFTSPVNYGYGLTRP